MSNSNTCIISGKKINDACKMNAAYLCKLIYEKPAGGEAFDTSWPQEIAAAKTSWEEWEDFDQQEEMGFVARLYKPKGYRPDSENDEAMCWPMLVFRGTDFDDFRGLAYHVSIRCEALADLWTDIKAPFVNIHKDADQRMNGVVTGLSFKDKQKEIDEYKKKAKTENPDSILYEATAVLDPDFLAAHKSGYSEADILAAGFKKMPELSFVLDGPLTGVLKGNAKIEVAVLINEKHTGDWANNLLQGIGDIENSPAYKAAMDTAYEVMNDHILKTYDRRLIITGHSLGGGLATAADFTARFANIGNNAQIYSLVFNTAGLHENTYTAIESEAMSKLTPEQLCLVRQQKVTEAAAAGNNLKRPDTAAGNGRPVCEQKPNSSDALVDIFRVQDEILTTLGYTPQYVPFLKGVMNILEQSLPRPVGSDIPMPALNPGLSQKKLREEKLKGSAHSRSSADGYKGSDTLPQPEQKLKPLPRLFPLGEQTLIPGQTFPIITKLNEIFTRYSSTMRYSTTDFSKCFNEMFEFIDQTFFDGKLKQYMASHYKDLELPGIINSAIKIYTQGKAKEIFDMMKILSLSSGYHGVDYVIASCKGYLKQTKQIIE